MTINDKLLKGLWQLRKVILCTLVFQAVFAVAFLFIGKYENAIVDLWFGGVMGTPVGYVFGLIQEHRLNQSSLRENRNSVILLGLIIIGLVLMALLFPLDQIAKSFNN